MTEHDLLVRVQRQIEGLKAQVCGLVIERDALLDEVTALGAENALLRERLTMQPEQQEATA